MVSLAQRANSLPPLRPRSREEIVAAAGHGGHFPTTAGMRQSRLADAGGFGGCTSGAWTQKPSRGKPPRTEELFRSLEAPLASSHLGSTRTLSRNGSRSSTPRGSTDRPLSRPASGDLPPRSAGSRPRKPPSHIRSLKAVYMGEEAAARPAEELDRALMSFVQKPEANNIEAQVQREVARIRSGEDAIKFFTRYGTDSTVSVKLLYFNRPPVEDGAGKHTGPYDLMLVSKEHTHAEYFNISAKGVVHFRPGEMSQCVPLAEWMQHTLMYRVLSSMSFFRLFPHRTALYHWRSAARYVAYCRRRQRFTRRCFLAKPPFLAPLMQSRSIISEVEGMQAFNIPDRCCQLGEFSDLQTTACLGPQGLQRSLEVKHDALVSTLERLAKAVSLAASGPEPWERERGPIGKERGKSMVQEKKDEKERQRRTRLAQEDEGMIGRCVQLVSYIFRATLTSLFHRAADELGQRILVEPGEQLKKLFQVSVVLQEDMLVLHPPQEAFEQVVDRLLKEALAAVDALPNLVTAPSLVYHATSAAEAMWPIASALAQDATWQEATSTLRVRLRAQLTEVGEFVQHDLSGPFFRVQEFGDQWDEAAFQAQTHTASSLAEDIEGAQRLQEELGRCRAQRVFGSLFLDARGLRDSLAPIPERALVAMKQALLALAQQRCVALTKRYATTTRAVDERPKGDAAFHAYVGVYQTVVEEQGALEEALEAVQALYLLLRKQEVNIPLDDRVLIDSLYSTEKHFTHKAMMDARLFIDRHREQLEKEARATAVTVTVEESLDETEALEFSLVADETIRFQENL